jgi:hypothetical protein
MFDHFRDFDRLVEDKAPKRSGDHRISLILWFFWDFRVYVMGMEYWTMGLPMFMPLCKCINMYLGNVRKEGGED